MMEAGRQDPPGGTVPNSWQTQGAPWPSMTCWRQRGWPPKLTPMPPESENSFAAGPLKVPFDTLPAPTNDYLLMSQPLRPMPPSRYHGRPSHKCASARPFCTLPPTSSRLVVPLQSPVTRRPAVPAPHPLYRAHALAGTCLFLHEAGVVSAGAALSEGSAELGSVGTGDEVAWLFRLLPSSVCAEQGGDMDSEREARVLGPGPPPT